MQLTSVRVVNFKSCRDVRLEFGPMHALVGANNAGKSAVLRALDFLFNPSSKNFDAESFWNSDTTLEIRVEATFSNLSANEEEALAGCLRPDGTFCMVRTAQFGGGEGDGYDDDAPDQGKVKISQAYQAEIPEPEWLREASISGKKIAEWWANREELKVGVLDFSKLLGTGSKPPKVGDWVAKANEFVQANNAAIPKKVDWIPNPKGYANVLKAVLPLYVLVPAVRDITEESKVTKTGPFGRLLYAILDAVTPEKRIELSEKLGTVVNQLNRSGGTQRLQHITEAEGHLNKLLADIFQGCDLEIEFETPTLETLLTAPRLFVNDGFRNAVENKGHGLQRAVIFSILRRYADHVTGAPTKRGRNLIIGIEEPELYMHPQAQRTIRKVLRSIADSGDQVIFSTHSALLVEVEHFDEIIRMEKEAVAKGAVSASKAWQLPMTAMIEDLQTRHPKIAVNVTAESMRDQYSNAYNPRRNEGFFASRIILVEGATEEYSLPIYASVLPDADFDYKGISIVECGGKGTMDCLYRVFNELRIPCFLLFDYDKDSTDQKTLEKSKELLTLVGEPTGVPSALLVSDRVACFPTKWEIHVGGEVPNVAQLTQEARRALGLTDSTGKPLVARFIARSLIAQGATNVPPSVKRVIEAAVKVKWHASCLQLAARPSAAGGL